MVKVCSDNWFIICYRFLCRSGKLDRAEDLVKKIPTGPNLSIWLALLSGCRAHSNIELAERAAEKIFNIDPHSSAAYVLLSNIYAHPGLLWRNSV